MVTYERLDKLYLNLESIRNVPQSQKKIFLNTALYHEFRAIYSERLYVYLPIKNSR